MSKTWVRTGRIDTRKTCPGCGARVKFGDPQPNATWPDRLRLTRETLDLLLTAAAEFIEAGDGTAVEFIDWVSSTALGQRIVHVEADGAPGRTESGGFARHKNYRHRHPFPVAQASLPQSIRRAAS